MKRLLAMALVLSLTTCGADKQVAPAAEVRTGDIHQCQSFEALNPALLKAIQSGKTEVLRRVVEEQLLKAKDGELAPLLDVLRAVFEGLTRLAKAPPELGAPEGEYCRASSMPPPVAQANELCELRRTLQALVHDGKGIDAINLLEPRLLTLLGYITGEGDKCSGGPRSPQAPAKYVTHYEVAALFSRMCAQRGNCQLSTGLDLTIAFTEFAATPEGKQMVAHMNALASRSSISSFLQPARLSEDQFVAMAEALIPVVQAADASGVDQAFNAAPIPSDVRADLQPLVADMKLLLGNPALTTPMRLSLECLKQTDPARDLTRMVYRILVSEQCEEFGLTKLTETAKQLESVDERGAFFRVLGNVSRAIRRDVTAVDSAASVCRSLFSTEPIAAQGNRSNAELLLPLSYGLVQEGVVNQVICGADTLLFGCAGGAQPACR